jgi:NAD(P)H-dependent FMN reductase
MLDDRLQGAGIVITPRDIAVVVGSLRKASLNRKTARLFDDAGKLIDDSTREFLGKVIQAYAAWVDEIAPARP